MRQERQFAHVWPFLWPSMQRLLMCGLLAAGVSASVQAAGEPAAPARASCSADGLEPKVAAQAMGTVACLACHRPPRPEDDVKYSEDVLNFVRLDQATVWEKNDKHRDAVARILDDRGLLMMERLGKAPADIEPKELGNPAYRTALEQALLKSRECLTCHAGVREQQALPLDAGLYKQGVGCEVCHGPSSAWFGEHTKPTWRSVSPEEKCEKFALIDLRNPALRAQLCFSCHIGSPEQGKVVTHEMYAAGHPPLPSIEIESFADQMPRHWWYISEKPDFEHRRKFMELNHLRDDDLPQSRAVVLGGLVAASYSAKLLAHQAGKDGELPDFAAFNCYDCHHDLRKNSWRQRRTTGVGTPGQKRIAGRPQRWVWPQTLIQLGVRQVSESDADYQKKVASLQAEFAALDAAVTSRPFGDSTAIRNAAEALERSLNALAKEIAIRPFSESDARRSLKLLANPERELYFDYESARQLAWGTRIIASELQLRPKAPVERRTADETIRDAFEKRTTVQGLLSLSLPSQRAGSIEKELPQSLERIYRYDPADFVKQWDLLRADLMPLVQGK